MHRGKIDSIDKTMGFGFIKTEDGEKIFFHQRWLRKVRFRDLHVGDEVVFVKNLGPRGARAFHLNLAGASDSEEIKIRPVDKLFKD